MLHVVMIYHMWVFEMVNKVQLMLVEPLCCCPWGNCLLLGVTQGQTVKHMQVLLVREPKNLIVNMPMCRRTLLIGTGVAFKNRLFSSSCADISCNHVC